jgi:siroheme synthase-like protein
MSTSTPLLPIFLKLEGRSCLVVGAGHVALEKIRSLLTAGAKLRVVAPQALPEVVALQKQGRLEWLARAFEEDDLDDTFLVIAATDSPEVNHAVYEAAVARQILANAVDDPPFCDFYFSSVVRRDSLQIAISTAGESPAVAQQLRREIDESLPEDVGPWLSELGKLRREVLTTHPVGPQRKELLHTLAQREICTSNSCPTRVLAARTAERKEESWWLT